MPLPTYICAACTITFSLIAIIFSLKTLRQQLLAHSRGKRQGLCESYVRQITKLLLDEQYRTIYPQADSKEQKMALAEAMFIVLCHTYGSDLTPIRRVAEENRLDRYILGQITRRTGRQHSYMLTLMSAIPSDSHIAPFVQPFLSSPDPAVRSSALLTLLAAAPSRAISTIASLPYRLRHSDIVRIITLLRRGILPIAYEPLLASRNTNLQLLGIAIVRTFGLTIAERQLLQIITSSSEPSITREALYTLASIGGSLHRKSIRHRIHSLPPALRKELCRHLTREGYSPSTMRTIFPPDEAAYSEALTESYKRNLECTQSFTA